MTSQETYYKTGILTVSDTASLDPEKDRSGPLLAALLSEAGKYSVQEQTIVPDEIELIRKTIEYWSDVLNLDLILITGGTGFASRDRTPEAVEPLLSKTTPGLTHLLLSSSIAITPFAALSRPITGIRQTTLIITFPGSPKACKENLSAILGVLPHGLDLLRGETRQHGERHGSNSSHAHQILSDRHHGHSCKHRSEENSEHKGRSLPLDTPVALRYRQSPYPLVSVQDAENLISAHTDTLEEIMLPVSQQLVGHVLAEDVKAIENVPGYRASIVDGYAVHSKNGKGIYVVGSVSLADESSANEQVLPDNQIARIATGGAVPPGADAVVMVEDTVVAKVSDDGKEEVEVQILATVEPGENIREVGSDCTVGTVVGHKGQPISTVGGELGVLASVGVQKVKVYRKPRVGVLSTGNEVVDHLDTTDPLKPGQIRDTNRITLLSAIETAGYPAIDLGIVSDKVQDIEKHLRDALYKVDVLITTGGVSMGEADFMKPILEEKLGATIHFGRVRMKPGKPTTFATVPFETQKKLVFALPGNPASATVTFYLFVLPALRRMAGYSQYKNPVISVKLLEDIPLDPRPEYHRVRVYISGNGLVAESTGSQRSSRMLSLRQANGLVELPPLTEERRQLKRNDSVRCVLIGPLNPQPEGL